MAERKRWRRALAWLVLAGAAGTAVSCAWGGTHPVFLLDVRRWRFGGEPDAVSCSTSNWADDLIGLYECSVEKLEGQGVPRRFPCTIIRRPPSCEPWLETDESIDECLKGKIMNPNELDLPEELLFEGTCGAEERRAALRRTPRGWSGNLWSGGVAVESVSLEHRRPSRRRRSLAVGRYHSCAIREGYVFCWGMNRHGMVGMPPVSWGGWQTPREPAPRRVALPNEAEELALGEHFSCARMRSGEIFCWGSYLSHSDDTCPLESEGEVGCIGHVPRRIELGASAVGIVAGARHACALIADGSVFCWGDNGSGQVDSGLARETRVRPARVKVPPASSIVAAARSTCAVVAAGVLCWGQKTTSCSPATVTELIPASDGAVDGTMGSMEFGSVRACLQKMDGRFWCWGAKSSQEHLCRVPDGRLESPVRVDGDWKQLSLGSTWCGIDGAGTLLCGSELPPSHGGRRFGSTASEPSPWGRLTRARSTIRATSGVGVETTTVNWAMGPSVRRSSGCRRW